MRIIRISAITAALLALSLSCTSGLYEKNINSGSGLGYPVKTYDLDVEAGEVHVDVIATMDYEIRRSAQWLQSPASAPAGRDGFTLSYSANEGLSREAEVIVAIEKFRHYDTLRVRQRGLIQPLLTSQEQSVMLKGSEGGTVTLPVSTNIELDKIALALVCEGETDWVSSLELGSGSLSFEYSANPEDYVRRASVSLTYEDAFEGSCRLDFQISQMSSSDFPGKEMSMAEFCALATEDGYEISSDIIISGIVVSDKENGNCGDNTQLGPTSIDYDVCRQTVYLESEDASRGIMLMMATPQDNTLLQGDRVKFSLRGATLYRSRVLDSYTTPVYYYVADVKGNMVTQRESLGREGLPLKERYIGALKDEDIFTYVTLKDCELPVRKGPLTPISERFTNATGSDKVAKFGILLHDIYGSSMYLYTNTTCPYRRNGERLPQGSGNMSGVVVHELYQRFNYMDSSSPDSDTWGNIGRYQLRHTCREDFAMASTMEEHSFSGIICEWRYVLDKNLEKYYATDGDKEAYFTYSFKYPNSSPYKEDGRAGKLPINKVDDYSYLGPVGAGQSGNVSGLGVILEDGSDWMGPGWNGYNSEYASEVNANGYGNTGSNAGSAWSTNLTARGGKPLYTTLVFSTAGISAKKMSLQLSSMNYFYTKIQTVGTVPMYLEGPRYWCVEYSLDNETWTRAGEYSLPEFCQTTPLTQVWQTPGFKQVNIPLPASTLLGRDKVYIRIIPKSLLTGSQTEYIDSSIIYPSSGSFPTAWNYIGVRYNTTDPPALDFSGDDIDPMNPIDYNW